MTPTKSDVEQSNPPLSPQESLPTMYDLPSEDPEEPGLPDEFHLWQPQLLSQTFQPQSHPPDQVFTASDLNLYYDVRHRSRYKRPDWFAVVGVPRLLDQGRLSYVIWQEGIAPVVAIELLSPSTIEEDQGETRRGQDPPSKWEVYEKILRIPYYVIFNRMADVFRIFQLQGHQYQELHQEQLWIPDLELGLGLWEGEFQGWQRQWLRWFQAEGWVLTEAERARLAEAKAARLAERLRQLGVDPDQG